MQAWREIPSWRRVLTITVLCLPLLDLVVCWAVAPQSWNWTVNNLQVRLHNDANLRHFVGSAGGSAGWSKLSLACGDWRRDTGLSTWGRGVTTIHDESHFRIAFVSPEGAWVRVRYRQETNGKTIAFDRIIFVPAHGPGRLDISPDLYLTGEFE